MVPKLSVFFVGPANLRWHNLISTGTILKFLRRQVSSGIDCFPDLIFYERIRSVFFGSLYNYLKSSNAFKVLSTSQDDLLFWFAEITSEFFDNPLTQICIPISCFLMPIICWTKHGIYRTPFFPCAPVEHMISHPEVSSFSVSCLYNFISLKPVLKTVVGYLSKNFNDVTAELFTFVIPLPSAT